MAAATGAPLGGGGRGRLTDPVLQRALARLWRQLHLRDRHRTVALHEGAALDLGPLGIVRCELAVTPSAAAPSLLSVGLVVLSVDDRRAALCAAAELPECWCLDLARGWTERLRHPDGGRYRTRELILPGERVAPERWPALAVTPLEG